MQIDPQMLHRLLLAVQSLQSDHAAMKVLVRAMAATHPNKAVLVANLRALGELRVQTDLGGEISDDEIEARRAEIERWARWIESIG